jgi:hypothetical protein
MSKEGSDKMKWIKRVLCLTLAFAMIITALPTASITETVYAKENSNGTGGGTQGAGGNLHGGPTESKQGYRIYIMTKSKKTLSTVYDCYFGYNSVSVGHYERDTRLGSKDQKGGFNITPQIQKMFGVPKAFYYSGGSFHGNGVAFKKWAANHPKKKNGEKAKHNNIYYFVQYVIGKEAYDKAENAAGDEALYVVVEPLAWHSVLPNRASKLNGQTILATGYEYLNFNAEHGFGSNTYTKILDNFILQYCMVLKRNELGLTKVDTHKKNLPYVTKSGLGKKGLSLHLYSLTPEKDAIDSTCTYDENYDSHYKPEKAPNKVTGTADEKEKKKEAYKVTIVKTYRVKKINLDGDVKYIDKGTFVRKYNPSTIDIENEPKTKIQYHVIGYQTTDKVKKSIDALKWKSIMKNKKLVGNATKSATVKPNNDAVVTTVTLHKKVEKQKNKKTGKTETVKQKHDETVLYVLLQKEEKEKPISGDYTLKQSQISKKVDLYQTEKGKNILKNHSFVWDSSALNDACGGHTYFCGGKYCSGHIRHCSWSLADTSLNLAIMNARYRADEYKYNIAYKAWDDEWEDTLVSGNRRTLSSYSFNSQNLSNIDGGTHRFEHYYLVFHRGKDALCLAKWKNTAAGINTASLEKLDSFYSANQSKGLRRKVDFKGRISAKFIDNSDDIYTSSSGSEGCSDSDVADSPIPFIAGIEIAYLTFSGSRSGGSSNNDIEDETMTNPGVHSGTHDGITYGSNTVSTATMAKSGLKFSFFPYIRMRYDSMGAKDKEVYVLGEYARSLNFNSACQVIWDKTAKPNMTLESLQWSTHSQALKNHEVNSVLPGGATFTLRVLSSSKKAKNNRQTITVKTYQPVLEGDGLTQVKNTTLTNGLDYSKFTRSAAEKNDEKTTKNIVDALNQLKVAQWQNRKDNSDPFKGILVDSGTDISSLATGSKHASTAKKYYFKAAKGKGFINAHIVSTSEQFYTFTADYKGNIKMNGTTILTKGQGKSYIKKLKNEPNDSPKKIALDINEKTLVLEKLCDALERNRGYDDDAAWAGSDGKWYNEAFDGITYEEITTKIETGMIEPTERSSVLDPKLCPINQGKSDFFSHFQTAGIKMNSYSDMYYNMDNMLGTFNGKDIYTEDLDKLYYTRPFYVPNVNVQDLH